MPKTPEKKQGFILRVTEKKLYILDFLSPLGVVGLRVFVALQFWKAGISKISSWESTEFLFAEEYRTHEKLTFFGNQIFSPEFMAYSATAIELILPILIIIGLGARSSAAILLVMTAVIEFTYQSSATHLVWAVMLGAIILQGAGRFSWDYFIRGINLGFPASDKDGDKLLAAFATLSLTIFAAYIIFRDVI